MEFHCSDDKAIASKVFELGLKAYHDKSDYVLHYLNFLIQINDEPSVSADSFADYRCESPIRENGIETESSGRKALIRHILSI
jgi:Suppressor of forked protein (Suf)